jgi:steroid 5-alpha reductase family enzyme
MLDATAYLWSGAALLAFAVLGWLASLAKNDVSIVDSLWSLMFMLALIVYVLLAGEMQPRTLLILALTAIWALRLALYISWRNHGEPEDPRYQAIRRNNEPGFRYKSLYIVFGLQALLAWVISLPLLVASSSPADAQALDIAGIGLFAAGFAFETVGDYQLARFKRDPAQRGRVLDTGLWRYTRHPNYFGEFTLWWGFYLLALAGGGWWTLISPLLMSWLLLKVSGVALLEKDIAARRPEYVAYIQQTNAFFPGPRRLRQS